MSTRDLVRGGRAACRARRARLGFSRTALVFVYTTEHLSAVRRSEVLTRVTAWTTLANLTLSERGRAKGPICEISFI